MDGTDLKILNLLISKPRVNRKEIAKKLGLTPPAITHRIRKMRESGIIKGFLPVANFEKLGFDVTMFSNIKVKYDKVKEATARFVKDRNVCAVYYIAGEYDLLVITKFKNTQEFSEWLARVNNPKANADFIERMNSSIVFGVMKEGFTPNKIC